MTTGTSTSTALLLQNTVQISGGRGWAYYPGEPVDITPTSTGPLDITPTANRRGQGR